MSKVMREYERLERFAEWAASFWFMASYVASSCFYAIIAGKNKAKVECLPPTKEEK